MHKYELLREQLSFLKNELLNQKNVLEKEIQDKTNKKYKVLNTINETKNKIAKKENMLNFINNFKDNIKQKVNKYFWSGLLSFIITSILMIINKLVLLIAINDSLAFIISGLFILNTFIFSFIFLVNNVSDIMIYHSEKKKCHEYAREIESLNLELENSRGEYRALRNLENELTLRLEEVNKNTKLCSNYGAKINAKISEINTKQYSNNTEAINEIFEVDNSIQDALSLVRRFSAKH